VVVDDSTLLSLDFFIKSNIDFLRRLKIERKGLASAKPFHIFRNKLKIKVMKLVKGFEVYFRKNENDDYQSYGIFENEIRAKDKRDYVYVILEIDDVIIVETEFVDIEPRDEDSFMMVGEGLFDFNPSLN